MSLQALREQRNAKAKAMADLTDEKRKWNAPADKPLWDTLLAEYSELDDQIKRIEHVNALTAERLAIDEVVEAADRTAQDKRSPQAKLFGKWLREGMEGLNAEERAIVRNTMSTTTGSQGGFTQQTEVAKQVLDALKLFGGMRAVAHVFQTAMGNPMSFPASDGTAETGEIIA